MTSLASLLFADINASIGVIGMMVGIVLLVVLLVALSLIEAAGEHAENLRSNRHHGAV